DPPPLLADHVDFGAVIDWKQRVLALAYDRARQSLDGAYREFCNRHAAWLDDFARFMAIKAENGLRAWTEWDPGLRDREPAALAAADDRLAGSIDRHRFSQFLFFTQWEALKARANERGIEIIGDLPIFVAHDSADVWARPDLFALQSDGRPSLVAGVPPDYFSPTGQLWGNPQYRWDRHEEEGFGWWLSRLESVLSMVDWVRIDHFRAFADYWEIPADAPTAQTGRWVDGPGGRFLTAVRARFGDIPIIAEDLGEISPAVEELRDAFDLPGMKILQFAFDDDETNPFLPHNYPVNCVAYTGTHDNDTTRGWWATAPEHERHYARSYLSTDGSDITWDLIEAAMTSRASFAIVPIQDVLDLPTTARMNTPGVPAGNWQWRMAEAAFAPPIRQRLRILVETSQRSG
ncbi:MAG: 4-alpha-glucanotransferase, partial [Acidimicrobiia bacterium]|nr:4-alpha-glucanotransferase [Acidimicrobiia bacterium]